MNKDIAEGQWKQLKARVREQWGRLTDDEVEQIGGKYDRLVGKIQEKYGNAKDDAAGQVNEFLARFEDRADAARNKSDKYRKDH